MLKQLQANTMKQLSTAEIREYKERCRRETKKNQLKATKWPLRAEHTKTPRKHFSVWFPAQSRNTLLFEGLGHGCEKSPQQALRRGPLVLAKLSMRKLVMGTQISIGMLWLCQNCQWKSPICLKNRAPSAQTPWPTGSCWCAIVPLPVVWKHLSVLVLLFEANIQMCCSVP